MRRWQSALGLILLSASLGLVAQPNRSPEAYGDPTRGQFGDPAQGHFGDASRGEFRRYNFSRAQEGTAPVLNGTPVDRFQAVPVPAPRSATSAAPRRFESGDAPYVTLDRPVDRAN